MADAAPAPKKSGDDGAPATIFQKILDGDIPSAKVYEDDFAYAFRDISPCAKTHILVIPKLRDGLTGLAAAEERHIEVLGRLMLACKRVAAAEGLADGYRVVVNNGEHGGQTVDHLHLHIIGGQQLTWPPGTGDAEAKKEA